VRARRRHLGGADATFRVIAFRVAASRRRRPAARPRTIASMTETAPTSALAPQIRDFIADTRFVSIATIDPDGGPRQAVVWYRLDGDDIVINSAIGRRWPANLLRDPRISLTLIDGSDGYRWVGLTGTVTAIRDQETAQADIAEMARRYHADDPAKAERLIAGRFERQERITFRVRIDAVHDHLDD
jgi:PPOX class probable F420-dependent enzyme